MAFEEVVVIVGFFSLVKAIWFLSDMNNLRAIGI
jgi:hypothetical protein